MARNTRSRSRSRAAPDPSQAVRDSAQKIWLAGLGAFERARTEGPRVFESLVEQGRDMGARAVGAADQAFKAMRQANATGGSLEKLEKAFEERVARSLSRLGVLTRDQADELSRQVRELNASLHAFAATSAKAAKGAGKRATGARRKAGASARRAKSGARARTKAKRAA